MRDRGARRNPRMSDTTRLAPLPTRANRLQNSVAWGRREASAGCETLDLLGVDDSTGGAPPPVGCRAAWLRYERPASRSAALCVCSLRIASLIVADAP